MLSFHPTRTEGLDVFIFVVVPSYILTCLGVNMVMYFASTNLLVLSRECNAFKVGTMTTIFVGCCRLCCNSCFSVAAAVGPGSFGILLLMPFQWW